MLQTSGTPMAARQSDFTPVIDLLREKGAGPVRAAAGLC